MDGRQPESYDSSGANFRLARHPTGIGGKHQWGFHPTGTSGRRCEFRGEQPFANDRRPSQKPQAMARIGVAGITSGLPVTLARSPGCQRAVIRVGLLRNTNNLSRFQWKLDLEHLIKINLPFRARELVISDTHSFVENSPSSLPVYVVPPRLMRIQDAARYLSATTRQIGTLLRENTIPSFVLGKRRVIDRLELDRYVERRNAEAKAAIGDT